MSEYGYTPEGAEDFKADKSQQTSMVDRIKGKVDSYKFKVREKLGRLSQKEQLSTLPQQNMDQFIGELTEKPFDYENETKINLITGEITEDHLLSLNSQLDFETSIIVVDNMRVAVTGNNYDTGSVSTKILKNLDKTEISGQFHSHTKEDSLNTPSFIDFGNYQYDEGLHTLVTNGKIMSYEMPDKFRDDIDLRETVYREIKRAADEKNIVIPGDLLDPENHDLIMELFVSTLPEGSVRYDTQEVLDSLNPKT